MARRSIGQEQFGFAGGERAVSSLDALLSLIDWNQVAELLDPLYPATKGEPCQRRPKIPQKCRCKIPQSRLSVINRIGDRGGAPLVAFRAGVAGVAV